MSLWLLLGVKLALIAGVESKMVPQRDFLSRLGINWLEREGAMMLFGFLLVSLVCRQGDGWITQKLFGTPEWWWFWCVLSLASLALTFLPFVRTGGWAFAMFAYLLGSTIVISRIASWIAIPANLRQWMDKWWPAFVIAFVPVFALLLPFGRPSDFAPALSIWLAFIFTWCFIGQPLAATVLGGITSGFVLTCYLLGFPARLVERIHLLLLPSEGPSDQQIQAMWAIARGGLLGRGIGHIVTNPNGYVAVPLPITDGIWSILSEALGFWGWSAVFALVGLIGWWIFHDMNLARDLRQRVLFFGAGFLWFFQHFATAAWTCRAFPIMGLAAPILSAGIFNDLFWFATFGLLLQLSLNPLPTQVVRLPIPSIPKFIISFFALFALLILTNMLRHSVLGRERVLTEAFQDRKLETFCREAIWRGWVVTKDGRVVLNEQRLKEDKVSQRAKRLLSSFVERGVFGSSHGVTFLRAESFRRSEPSGLGILLKMAREGERR